MSNLLQEYYGQKTYTTVVGEIRRVLPVTEVGDGVYIASNASVILGDVEFIIYAGKLVAERIREYSVDVIVTPEAKSLALAYEVAKNLGHSKYVVARKSVKSYMKNPLIERVRSITTKEEQILVLCEEEVKYVKDRRVCILDDVVSTGGTMKALERLVKKAGGNIVCRAAIWLEGPWMENEEIIYLSTLPIFRKK
ncbi:MAG TPA: phosphoribosyltransferase [Candidatus Bathyarchaeota archaeon]|nr:phosphoribosyltransferase [Candidatus Bathyarchaeota archaeon]